MYYCRWFDVALAMHPIVPIHRRSCIHNQVAQRVIASVHDGRTIQMKYTCPIFSLPAQAIGKGGR